MVVAVEEALAPLRVAGGAARRPFCGGGPRGRLAQGAGGAARGWGWRDGHDGVWGADAPSVAPLTYSPGSPRPTISGVPWHVRHPEEVRLRCSAVVPPCRTAPLDRPPVRSASVAGNPFAVAKVAAATSAR